MKATDIYEFLIKKGFDISYPSVSNIVRSLKDTLNEAFIKQEYSLGNIYEFDWGEVKLNIDNKGFRKYQLAVFTTAYGNYRFAVLFETQDTIAFQQSHALFFEHVGGIYNTMVYDNMKIAEHVRTFGLFDLNIKLEHYLNTLHKKSGALENSTAMLNLDTQIKNIYNKYFTQNPKEFLDLYEIILEKGISTVQNVIEELEKISPIDISAEKVKLICNKKIIEENIDTINDEIAIASNKLLIQYKSLVPNSNVQFIRQEVMIQILDYQKEINNYCKILKTPAIRKNYKEQISDNISFEEYLYNLLKLEYESREENAKQNKLRLANFPYKKYIEDLDMDALPEDGRKKLKNFLTLEFIKTRSKYNFSWEPRNW